MSTRRKRTKKVFHEYNEYHDRPFGLKWGTAFEMEELTKGITRNSDYALKDNQVIEQMDQEEIDLALSQSLLYSKEVEIQLNLKDEFGRFVDLVIGIFQGEAYEDYFVMDEKKILWNDVRSVKLTNTKKWSQVEMFDTSISSIKKTNLEIEQMEYIKDEFYQPFVDENNISENNPGR